MLQTAETLSFQLFRVPLITQHFLVVAQHQALPAQLITASVARASSGTLSSRLPTQALSMWGTRRTLLIPSCNCYIQHSEEHRLAEKKEREREILHCFSEAKTSESCPDDKASVGGGFSRRTSRRVCQQTHARPAVEKTGSFCRRSFRTSGECDETKYGRTCISTWAFDSVIVIRDKNP